MNNLSKNYNNIKVNLKNNSNVTLIAVSKTFYEEQIRELYQMGQRDFGENYVQEFLLKFEKLKDLAITWHFIGNLQSNKIKQIAQHINWVHSISNLKQIRKLNEYRASSSDKLNVLLEVNISGEEGRHGVRTYDEIIELVNELKNSKNLKFRGLMGIASATNNQQIINNQFNTLKILFERLKKEDIEIDTISMGMSNDYQQAINNGSTMIRIGSLIFGSRSSLA